MLYIGADHRGFYLKEKIKEFLKTSNIDFQDIGAFKYNKDDDYVDFASQVAKEVQKNPKQNKGIIICGTGIGNVIVANKFKNIRATQALTALMAQRSREHNDANILSLAADFTDPSIAWNIIKRFLKTSFIPKPNYIRRIKKIQKIEKNIKK